MTCSGFQALIYGNGHDAVLKQALKNRKTPEETMSYGGLEELVKDCVNYLPTPHKSQVRVARHSACSAGCRANR